MNISNYLEEQLVRHTLGVGAYANVTPVYVGLLSDMLQDGSVYTEFSGSNYARQSVAAAGFVAASGGATYNVSDITWPAATADWGTVTHIGIFDSIAAGNMLWWAELPIPKFVAFSAVFRILAGELDISAAGAFSLYLRNGILNFTLRNVALASPAAVYGGVGTGVSANNASLSEPTGGYNRIQITGLTQVANGAYTISAPAMAFTASGDNWGSITHFGIFDALVAGNLLYALGLSESRPIYNGDGLQFDASSVIVRVL